MNRTIALKFTLRAGDEDNSLDRGWHISYWTGRSAGPWKAHLLIAYYPTQKPTHPVGFCVSGDKQSSCAVCFRAAAFFASLPISDPNKRQMVTLIIGRGRNYQLPRPTSRCYFSHNAALNVCLKFIDRLKWFSRMTKERRCLRTPKTPKAVKTIHRRKLPPLARQETRRRPRRVLPILRPDPISTARKRPPLEPPRLAPHGKPLTFTRSSLHRQGPPSAGFLLL